MKEVVFFFHHIIFASARRALPGHSELANVSRALLKGMESKMKNRCWLESFGHALDGIRNTVAKERNFRIQIIFGIIAIIGCIIFSVEPWQFMLVIFAIFFVLAMELMNTAIEALTDLSCKGKIHPLAKTAKDAAAAAVLVASVFAAVVGVVITVSIIRRWI